MDTPDSVALLLGRIDGKLDALSLRQDEHAVRSNQRFDEHSKRMDAHSKRLSNLEKLKWLLAGAVAVATFGKDALMKLLGL